MTFEDLEFRPHELDADGEWATAFFPNGFGVSVIRFSHSHGGPDGLYEVAVLRGPGVGECKIDMSTPITDDVVGWLRTEDVTQLMAQIEALEEVKRVRH